MKSCRYLQIALILLFGSILFVTGPSKVQSPEKLWAGQTSAWGYPYYYYRPHYYRHNYNPYFRYYMYPRTYYRLEITITVREDASRGEKITVVYVDGNRLNLTRPSPKGNRGTYYYRIGAGNHMIEWTVEDSNGKTQDFSRKFYINPSDRSVNILIDGDEFYRQ